MEHSALGHPNARRAPRFHASLFQQRAQIFDHPIQMPMIRCGPDPARIPRIFPSRMAVTMPVLNRRFAAMERSLRPEGEGVQNVFLRPENDRIGIRIRLQAGEEAAEQDIVVGRKGTGGDVNVDACDF